MPRRPGARVDGSIAVVPSSMRIGAGFSRGTSFAMQTRMHPSPIVSLALVAIAAAACSRDRTEPGAATQPSGSGSVAVVPTKTSTLDAAAARALFQPLPTRFESTTNPSTPEKIALGRMLYFDARLSKAHDLSCNGCHPLDRGGVDGARFSKGHKGQLGGRNAPTVLNAAGQLAQFWDGRAADVEEQAKGPVLNPVEMAMPDAAYVVRVLRSIPAYVDAFHAAFPESKEITYDDFGRAIGAFERGLVTPTRFDAFLAGKDDALDAGEREGLATFVSTGCAGCHNGALVGGGAYMKLGVVSPFANVADLGRFDVTKNEGDRMVFKVPTLRNVADTAPYFHDGSIGELPDAVRTMARLQLGKTLSDDDVTSIVRFLGSLSGKPPADYVKPPTLPASGPTTPPPQT